METSFVGEYERVEAVMDDETGIIELTVHGRWDRRVWTEAVRVLSACLAGHPAGLILDLSRFEDPRAGSAALWLTAAAQGRRMEPPVPVAVCVAPSSGLSAELEPLGPHRSLRSATTAITSHRTRTSQVRLQLLPRDSAAASARQLVTAACEEWAMPMLLPRARLVASELVANSVEHACTPIDMVISHRGPVRRPSSPRSTYLHLAVYDQDRRMPRPRDDRGPRGRGLHIIEAAVQAWGALPTREGKVVWAMLREQPD